MENIKQLPRDVCSSLRSSFILFDLSRVVEELIYNSLDAGATKVNVALSVGECYVKVEDDGSGVTRDELLLLGEKYATSKLSKMDIASENFGFRGEALASLSDVSLLEVTTKARGRPNAYRKIIKGCKCLYLGIDDNRQEMGTTVVVRDLFYNQPVRRKYMLTSPKKVLHSIKKCVLRVALVHPQVFIRVRDIESEGDVFCSHPSPSPLSLVSTEFGADVSCLLHELSFCKGIWKLSGYISAPVGTCYMKALQYIYINSQFVSRGPIHKLLSNLADSSKRQDTWTCTSGSLSEKRSRPQSYPAYILNLFCPRSHYDLTFEPSKTLLEFKDWVPVLSFIEEAIRQFWRKTTHEGEPHGMVDEALVEGGIWKNDDNILSSIQGTEEFSDGLDITKKKRRLQCDENFLCQSTFSLGIELEESDHLMHPKKQRRASEAYCRKTKKVEDPGYFHQTGCSLQKGSLTCCNAFNFTTIPVVSRENPVQVWLPDNNPLAVENCMSASEGQLFDDTMNSINLGSGWNSEFDSTVSNGSPERQTFCDYDYNKEAQFAPMCSRGSEKLFLRRCPLLGKRPLGDVVKKQNAFETEGGDDGRSPGIQVPHDVNNEVDSYDNDYNLDVSPNTFSPDMFAASGCSSILTRQHSLKDINVRSADFINCHLTEVASFTEGIKLHCSSIEKFGRSGSDFLPENSVPFSPYSDFITVGSEVGHVVNGNYIPCKSASSNFFSDRERSRNSSYASGLHGSEKEVLGSSCTNIDLGYENSGRNFSTSPSHEYHSSDFSFQKDGSYHRSSCEMNWSFLESSVTDKANNCATPTPRISPYCHKNTSSQEEMSFKHCGPFRYGRSRRSRSAPPFYKGKNKLMTYSCTAITEERESSSPILQVNRKHASQICNVSQHKFEQSPTKYSPQNSWMPGKMPKYDTEHIDQIPKDFTSTELEDLELAGVKWRNGKQQPLVVHESENHSCQEENDILDIFSGFLHLASYSVVPESVWKNCLENAKVLLQLDKKFIPVAAGMTLAVIDQHAADERIRLEELRDKVLSGVGISVTYLDSEQVLVLPEIGYQLMQNYAELIQNWGWICNVNAQDSGSFTKNLNLLHRRESIITLLAVPCILGVKLSDKDLLEFLDQLAETDGSSTLPQSVIRVLSFKACRGAIMFGDALLPSECSLIIEELRKTSLCFQCAHGRPTTAPLVNLEALHKQIAKLNNWNKISAETWHGLHRHKTSLKRARLRLSSARGQCD